MGTHFGGLVNPLFVSSMSCVLIGVSCQSSICLQYVMGTHWSVLSILYLSPVCYGYSLECPDNRQFVSSMSWVLIGSVLSILYLSPVCHGYSLECLVNPLFVSSMLWVLIGSVLTIVNLSPVCHGYSLGVSCQSSICLQYVMGTHWECPDNPLFVSSMLWVLSGSVLTIVNLSPLCHGYSLECLVNPLFVSSMPWVLIGVSCQSSICLQYVMGTHWSVLSILYLSPVCYGYSLGVS